MRQSCRVQNIKVHAGMGICIGASADVTCVRIIDENTN